MNTLVKGVYMQVKEKREKVRVCMSGEESRKEEINSTALQPLKEG